MKGARRSYGTISVGTTVDVDVADVIKDLSDDDLREICAGRQVSIPTAFEEDLLRQALEERDWSKVEQIAERANIFWFRRGCAAA